MKLALVFLAGYTLGIALMVCFYCLLSHALTYGETDTDEVIENPQTALGRKIIAFRKRWQEEGVAPLSDEEIRERLRWRN